MTDQCADDLHYMKMAIKICEVGVDAGQSPFGAVIVCDGKLLATAHNQVWLNCDATAHAEVNAIRSACETVGQPLLAGATIYSTTEPCPMCFTAIHWARIKRIVYGCSIEDAASFGFNELPVSNQHLKEAGQSDVEIVPGICREECLALFKRWQQEHGNAY